MSWIDLVVVGIFLVGFLVGIYKGFFKSFLMLISTALAVIVAYFLKDTISELLENMFELGTSLSNFIAGKVNEMDPSLGAFSSSSNEELIQSVSSSNLTVFLKTLFTNYLGGATISAATSVVALLSTYLAGVILEIISFGAIFIVAQIVFSIIIWGINKTIKNTGALKFVDRILGGVVGLVKVALWLVILLVITVLLSKLPGLDEKIISATDDSLIVKALFGLINDIIGF